LTPIYQLAGPGNSVLSLCSFTIFCLCSPRRIDAFDALDALDALDRIHNPATLYLDAGRAIRKRCRSLRPVKKEHVQVPIAGHAEIGSRTHLPRVTQCSSIDIAQTHILHPTGDRVEVGSEGDDIEFVQHTVGGENVFRPDFGNQVSFDVNHIYVVFAELLNTGAKILGESRISSQ